MVLRTIGLSMGLCLGIALGQNTKVDTKGDETAIRALVAADKRPPYATHHVFWSGAMKRPAVDDAKPDYFSEEAVGKRKNQKTSNKIQRLEVAASGDMAWEYSTSVLEFDTGDAGSPKHVKFETGLLRVWKKESDQWKVSALFVRPLDVPFAER